MDNFKLIITLFLFFLIACSKSFDSKEIVSQATTPTIMGWFDGECFASLEKNLAQNTSIVVIGLGVPQVLGSAKIIGVATSENCGPLADDRREQNQAEGYTFYSVKHSRPIGLAIGIVANNLKTKIENDNVLADLNGDGKFEQFTHCTTSEGISFDIWDSAPFEAEPVWSGYYFLGYDVERSCP